jgi:hypothetical protein
MQHVEEVVRPPLDEGVRITGIDIGFWEIVRFLVLVSIAAIPAALILALFGFVLFAVLGGLGMSLGS